MRNTTYPADTPVWVSTDRGPKAAHVVQDNGRNVTVKLNGHPFSTTTVSWGKTFVA